MKKLFIISLGIFWVVVVSVLTAGFLMNEKEIGKMSDTSGTVVDISTSSSKTSKQEGGSSTTEQSQMKKVQLYLDEQTVSKHNTKGDCWFIVHNKVYDVTEYIPFHPGGAREIVTSCGKEATMAFDTKGGEGAAHSRSANTLLTNYFVGNIGDPWGTVTVPEGVEPSNSDSGGTTEVKISGGQTALPSYDPAQLYKDTIEKEYPGAQIIELTLEDDGRAEFKITYHGKNIEGKMNAQYQVIEVE